jgi:hypothetical protein
VTLTTRNNQGVAAATARRHSSTLERIALVAALAPIAVAALRAGATGWVPEYDAAYFTSRSLDVFTARQPLVGAWSTLSAQVGESFNNLGPLQLLSLAPFTRVEPYWGTAIAVALVNGIAVFAVWCVSGALFGGRGRVGVMLATLLLELNFGGLALIDPRQQLALILPFWAFLWLTVALMCGHERALLPWIAAGSFVLQTHFSYAYIVLLLVICGTAGFLLRTHSRWHERSWWTNVVAGLGLALALWALPLWDQVAGSRNLGEVVRRAGGTKPSGVATGVQIVADSPLSPPFWLPGAIDSFSEPWSYTSSVSWIIAASWTAALGIVAYVSHRRHRRRTVAVMALLAIGLIAAALATASRIPTSPFGLLPQNYFWMWPIALFGMCVLGAALMRVLTPSSVRVGTLVIATIVVALPALKPRQAFANWDVSSEITGVGGRPLLEEIAQNLEAVTSSIGTAVLVEPTDSRLLFPDYYNVLGVLLRHGVDVHFPVGSDDLHRFGQDRCEDGTERWRLRMVVGPDRPAVGPRDIVLGQRDGPLPAAAVEVWLLRSRMSDWLVEGVFGIDEQRLTGAGRAGTEIRRLRELPGWPHADLWLYLPALVDEGIVSVPSDLRAAYDRWLELERSTLAVDLLVYLTPNWVPARGCAA